MEGLASYGRDLLSNSTSLVDPIMHAFSSLVLLGTFAFQAVLGRPESLRIRRETEILKRSVDSFISTESPIALRNLLCNIGSSGCSASGASAGVVIASPSKDNPDCSTPVPPFFQFTCFYFPLVANVTLQTSTRGRETLP